MPSLAVAHINKAKALAIATIVIGVLIGGYFVVTGIQLRQAELELLEEHRKPKAQLGFWNRSGKDVLLKVTFDSGDITWFRLSSPGGSYGSYDPGTIKIERIVGDESIGAINVTLDKGADVTFDVHRTRIAPRLGSSNY